MIDTHTHLYMEEFTADDPEGGAGAVDRALEAGVRRMVFPAVDRESVAPIIDLHSRRKDCTFLAAGLHPTEVGDDWEEELREIVDKLLPLRPVAIGETGMDLYWTDENLELQKDAFIAQLLLAVKLDLPVIIHCRDAVEECCECIGKAIAATPSHQLTTLIFHSFTGTPEDVARIRRVCDPYFGINGVVTFKNAKTLPDAVRQIGLERILLETDSPFLAPVPKRGSRNESAFIPYINDRIAGILGVSPQEVDAATTRNANKVFRF